MNIARNAVILMLLGVSFATPLDAEAITTKKTYERYLATLPPQGEAPSADYAREAATRYLRKVLKDSESARYEWGSIESGTWRGMFERFGTPGWIFSVEVNAKNSYGGYTGFKGWRFVFRSNSIVEVYSWNDRAEAWIGQIGVKGTPIPAFDFAPSPTPTTPTAAPAQTPPSASASGQSATPHERDPSKRCDACSRLGKP